MNYKFIPVSESFLPVSGGRQAASCVLLRSYILREQGHIVNKFQKKTKIHGN
jgi:hypothetical protein